VSSNITTVIADLFQTAGLGYLNLSRDEAAVRDTTAMPYAVSKEGISTGVSPSSGRGVVRLVELVQIDLMQNRAEGPDDPALMPLIRRTIDAAGQVRMTGDAATVYRLQPQQSVRFYDPKTQIVTESLTVRVTRTS
jgi:hypothetical protein